MSPTVKRSNGLEAMTPARTDSSHANFNSSTDPMQRSSEPSSVRQMGRGMPQKRDRLRFQSFTFSSHLPKRPVPVLSGFQVMVWFNSCIRAFASVARMNHESSG